MKFSFISTCQICETETSLHFGTQTHFLKALSAWTQPQLCDVTGCQIWNFSKNNNLRVEKQPGTFSGNTDTRFGLELPKPTRYEISNKAAASPWEETQSWEQRWTSTALTSLILSQFGIWLLCMITIIYWSMVEKQENRNIPKFNDVLFNVWTNVSNGKYCLLWQW